MPTNIRAFNAEGMRQFRAYVASGKYSEVEPPRSLLSDPQLTRELNIGSVSQNSFEFKFDLGMHVCSSVGKENLPKLMAEQNVWPWLSLYFSKSTFPEKDGNWFIGATSRHIVEKIAGRNQDHSHRHLVRGAVVAVMRFGQHARVLLGKSHEQTKLEEQVMSRNTEMGLSSSSEMVKLLYKLYWDPQRMIVRRGAKSDGKGSIMRVIEIMRQLDVTYDIASLKADTAFGLLPPGEFDIFAQAA